jgi:hypothetical protein
MFFYHLINAQGPVSEVEQNIIKELKYQSSLELEPATFEIVRGIPLANEIVVHARQELVRRLDGYAPGFTGSGAAAALYLFDGEGEPIASEHLGDPAGTPFEPLLEAAAGRALHEFAREFLLILLEAAPPAAAARFASLRRRALREVLGKT